MLHPLFCWRYEKWRWRWRCGVMDERWNSTNSFCPSTPAMMMKTNKNIVCKLRVYVYVQQSNNINLSHQWLSTNFPSSFIHIHSCTHIFVIFLPSTTHRSSSWHIKNHSNRSFFEFLFLLQIHHFFLNFTFWTFCGLFLWDKSWVSLFFHFILFCTICIMKKI